MGKKHFKKVLFLLFIIGLLFIYFGVRANTFKVVLSDINVDETNMSISNPTFINNDITDNIVFEKPNDYVIYEITLKNNHDSSYKVSSIEDNNTSNYLKSSYEYEKTNIEKNSTYKFKVKLLYKNTLENIDHISIDDLKITINMEKEDGSTSQLIINNPKTGDSVLKYLIILIIVLVGYISIKVKQNKKGLLLLLLTIVLIPTAIFAKEVFKVIINVNNITVKGVMLPYNVVFNLSNNPITRIVHFGEEIGEFPNGDKDGYNLIGWEDTDGNEIDEHTIVKGDLEVNPKYTIINYTITYDLKGGTVTGNPTSYNVEQEKTLNNPTKQGFSFSGWTGSNGDVLQTSVTIERGTTGDLHYVANYSANENTSYKVIHKKQKLTLDGYDIAEEENLEGTTDTVVRPQTKTYEGYNAPTEQDLTITADGNATLVYEYDRIMYNYSFDEFTNSTLPADSYPYGTEVTVSPKTKAGYTFDKWEDNSTASPRTIVIKGDTNVVPAYNPNTNTAYKVIHKKQKLTLDGYDIAEELDLTGTTDSSVTPGVKTYEGFEKPPVQTVTINGDGSTVVEYLYNRKMYSFNIEEPEYVNTTKESDSYPYGTIITVTPKDRIGYHFINWDGVVVLDEYTFELTGNKLLKINYEANDYTLTLDPNTGTYNSLTTTSTKTMTYDSTNNNTIGTATKEGYTFIGWYTEANGGTLVYDSTGKNVNVNDYWNDSYPSGKWVRTDNATLYAQYSFDPITITYNANGGSFTDNSTTRDVICTYEPEVNKYSHTSNIDDLGNQNGNYPDNLATKDVVTIPGATSMHVTITYGTENNYDMLYVFEGEYTGSVSKNMEAGQLQKYMGSNSSPETVELDVTGDTVTFAFYSDYSTNYYGYYAKVSSGGTSCTPEYEAPTKSSYILEGWYTDPELTNRFELNSSNMPVDLSSNRTVYAKYREATATFDTGSSVNAKMKYLAGNSSATSSSADTSITGFQKSTTIPNEYKTSDYIVSSSDSDVPIYMWFDNGIIYWYTDAPGTVYLNPNSSNLFKELRGITSIELDKFDTSNVTNMSDMFYYCLDLQNLDVSHLDTINVTDMSFMFSHTNLISLDLSNLDTSNVTNMENMFYGCDELTNLNVSSFNTSNVTNMSRMFQECIKLPTLDVTNFDTSNVTNMQGMFYECNNLTTLDVSHFVTNNVTDMSDMFYDCNNLTTLDVSHFVTNNVTDMSYMFGKCTNLTSLDVSHFNTSQVTNMEDMFYDCEKITSLDVTHFDTSKVTNMKAMFRDCYNLTTLDVTRFVTDNVTTMKEMFRACVSLPTLDVTHFNTSNVTNMYGMFEDCTNLTSLDVTHFDTRNVTTMGWMFRNCHSLTTLDVTHFVTDNVTNMDNMFCLCSGLTTIDVTHFNTSNVTTMNSMFNQCTNLVSVDVSGFNTSNVTDMGRMFLDCKNLESIDVTHFDTSNVQYMNYMFDGCSKLTTLDVTHFNTSNVEYMNNMFEGCTGLTTLDLSSFNTSNVHAINEMFRNDSNLRTVYVSNYFDTSNASSSWSMFTSCYNLTGGNGTTLNSDYLDKTYARVDDPDNGNPGYFTYKAAPTGASISKVSNLIKNNGNKIVLLGSGILVIILGLILGIVKLKTKKNEQR